MMGKFKTISRVVEHTSDFAITLDKQKRVCINAAFARELGHKKGDSYFLYYDEGDQRVGLSKTGEDAEPYKFDERGNASARGFIRQTELKPDQESIKLIFDGQEGEIYAFRIPGRKHLTFKQEKNGNIEKC